MAARQASTRDLEREFDWFARLLDARFQLYFQLEGTPPAAMPPPPDLGASDSAYAQFLHEHIRDDLLARTALVLVLVQALRPRLLDLFHTRNSTFDRRFTEFGGVRAGTDGDFTPTGETLAFLLGGDSLDTRLAVIDLLAEEGMLARADILHTAPGEEPMRSALRLGRDTLARMALVDATGPAIGTNFPAQRIETALDWSDLVLHPGTRAQIGEIAAWIEHGTTLMHEWGMQRLLRPGYRSLFYGPPGTGKTMTAALLGVSTGRPVYKIDLSLVISKYIGETEKNLARVFDQAQSRGWLLFFDEADALFGKRGESKDAHDRYANQEVAFLLQRIETFDGIAILASNYRDNIDEAFARRFESIIHFPLPRAEERRELWRKALPAMAQLADDVDLDALSREHGLTGGAIVNAIRFAALASLADGGRPIGRAHLLQAIRREYAKEGRSG
ncbi:ATP-binding protein [Sphingomonas sp. HF-S4]|uniref:ATP-binding protein n=1 Tax=Sphingomonas agrestis TaxID=3080540 RepID=A0ABU3Y2B2_9SPHN|nr:ATP-binding protein [Sphingomonas sp. HF-S4]MDV3455378.1 ATP-binding protein [Sphingomonas sp. HF-S4]